MTMVGGCLCGKVRYEVNGDPKFVGVCHCTHCQKQSGSAFSVNLAVSASKLSVEGDVKAFEDSADSGATLSRRFCPECGSALFSVSSGSPGLVFVKGGTLDDASGLSPALHVWTSSAQPWVKIDPDTASFKQQPVAG